MRKTFRLASAVLLVSLLLLLSTFNVDKVIEKDALAPVSNVKEKPISEGGNSGDSTGSDDDDREKDAQDDDATNVYDDESNFSEDDDFGNKTGGDDSDDDDDDGTDDNDQDDDSYNNDDDSEVYNEDDEFAEAHVSDDDGVDDDEIDLPEQGEAQKPYLVFHVGPPKTATTTLQTDLAQYTDILMKRDNYDYAGRYYFPYFDEKKGRIFPNRSEKNVTKEAVFMFNSHRGGCSELGVACLDHFKELLEPFRERGVHLLMSDEAFATEYHEEQLRLIQEEVGQDWHIVLIVGYRRFYDWLKSNHFQIHRVDYKREKHDLWPGQRGRGRKPGSEIPLLFPDDVYNWREIGQYNKFTTNIMENAAAAGVDVRILDLHKEDDEEQTGMSVRTNFLCHALPDAPNSCKKSRHHDQKVTEELHANTHEKSLHFNYDLITTAAAAKGLVDTDQYTRTEVRNAVQAYNEDTLGKKAIDFALHCPDQEDLDYFLQESLDLERQVFGADYTDKMEEAHREAFQGRVEAKDYCGPNVDAVLSEEQWQSFFADFAG